MRSPAPHAGMVHQGQMVPAQAMYPMQQVYVPGMAVPQYGYMLQQAVYHQSHHAYAGNGSAYSTPRDYQPPQPQPDYNCQVGPLFALLMSRSVTVKHHSSTGKV